MPTSPSQKIRHGPAALVMVAVAMYLAASTHTRAEPTPANMPSGLPLHLEVFVNDQPTNLIAAFIRADDGSFWSQRKELKELKLAPVAGGEDDYVRLDDMPGLQYEYREASQTLHLNATDDVRATNLYDGLGRDAAILDTQSDFGMVLNYNAFAAASNRDRGWAAEFSGANLALDGRMFGPLGVFSQTAIIGSTTFEDFDVLRLDTQWSYSTPENEITYRAGDFISGGLAWSRPVRLGGFQVQRNFALRPDLVTVALPKFSGSAAVPSTVDVYVNNVKSFSQKVDSGPFEISNIPTVGRGGTANVVINDAQGRQTTAELPFFVSPNVLAEGLLDFSVEGGFARNLYGIESFDYDPEFSASATLRYGVTDDFTLESHAEFSPGLINAGLGAVVRVKGLGVVSAAFSASDYKGESGAQIYGALETDILGASLNVSTKRTFGDYHDLASVTGVNGFSGPRNVGDVGAAYFGNVFSFRAPKAIDTASLSIPIAFDNSSLSLSYVHIEDHIREESNILALSYNRPLWDSASAYVTAFADLDDRSEYGIFAGVSFPLGPSSSAHVGVAANGKTVSPSLSASKSLNSEPGSYGWRVDVTKSEIAQSSAFISTRTEYATLEAGVRNHDTSFEGSVQASGALTFIDGDVYAANRIDDSFAVVDTGYADTTVMLENRKVGRTDSTGKILVPGLRAYQANKISVDPLTLPLEAELATTSKTVATEDRAGTVVKMRARNVSQAGLIKLVDVNGNALSAGLAGRVIGTDVAFVVGYDGQAYINNIGHGASLAVNGETGDCQATIAAGANGLDQVNATEVVCR